MAINTATVKECPIPFRHPASSLHPRTVMTHEFRLIFYPPSFLFEPARFFPNTVYGIVFFFFDSQLAPMQLFLEEYPGWSSFRNGRVGMWAFSEGGCASRACELYVSETANIFATRLFVKLIMLEEINGAIYKINILFKMCFANINVHVTMLKIDDLILSIMTMR